MFSKVQFSRVDSVKNPDAKLPLENFILVHWLFFKRERQKVKSIRVLSAEYSTSSENIFSITCKFGVFRRHCF